MTAGEAHRKVHALAEEEGRNFDQGVKDVKAAQENVLADILRSNSTTRYGREYDFSNIRSVDDFRERVPPVDYDLLAGWVEKIEQGQSDILFPGQPICLQPTSGTTSAGKYIPFTTMLQRQFRAAVFPWLSDLYRHEPGLLEGPWYWSLSPMAHSGQITPGGVVVGFPDDAEYLGSDLGHLLRNSFAVPSEVTCIENSTIARKLSLAFLLQAEELALVSIWNPSFFSLLLNVWDDNKVEIIEALESGVLPGKAEIEKDLYDKLQASFGCGSAERAKSVSGLLGAEGILKSMAEVGAELWPNLKVLSCWMDADASSAARRLEPRFPDALFQPKGLIATEGIVSIPLVSAEYPVLAVRSHFYEFSPLDDSDKTLTVDQLEDGALYQVMLTTGGGLYRYRLGDVVKVYGRHYDTPMIEFMGRGHSVSDHYGEKLHQLHVAGAVSEVLREFDKDNLFTLLAPDGDDFVSRYCLFVSMGKSTVSSQRLREYEKWLDSKLRENFHFNYCRRVGQLGQTRISCLDLEPETAEAIYIGEMNRRGIKEGDVKPSILDARPVWRSLFGGRHD
jgi:hypothetical protein